jgi:protein gp37
MAKGSETGGCLNCYAARMAARNLPEMRSPTTGEPFAVMRESGPRWTGHVELIPEKLDEPLRWRKPRRVFVNSMSDLFHEALAHAEIARVFAVMADAPQHTFQILTKRPERMRRWFAEMVPANIGGWLKGNHRQYVPGQEYNAAWPLPNVWLGVSVEDQKTADLRVQLLLETPAAVRFVSYEPGLGPIDFEGPVNMPGGGRTRLNYWLVGRPFFPQGKPGSNVSGPISLKPALDWVIVGGESGPGARPFDVAWARSVVAQCKAAGVACFVKQLGARPVEYHCASGKDCTHPDCGNHFRKLRNRKGGDMAEWPADLRVREFPEPIRLLPTSQSSGGKP